MVFKHAIVDVITNSPNQEIKEADLILNFSIQYEVITDIFLINLMKGNIINQNGFLRMHDIPVTN